MKQITLLIFSLFAFMHLSGQNSSASITGGYTTNGVAFMGNYNFDLNSNSYIHTSGSYGISTSKVNQYEIDYNTLFLNIGYYYNIHRSLNRRFTISLGGGGLIGYEDINNGNEALETGAIVNADSTTIYGAFIGADTSYSISDYLSLALIIKEDYHINSDLGNFNFYSGVGLRYNFY